MEADQRKSNRSPAAGAGADGNHITPFFHKLFQGDILLVSTVADGSLDHTAPLRLKGTRVHFPTCRNSFTRSPNSGCTSRGRLKNPDILT